MKLGKILLSIGSIGLIWCMIVGLITLKSHFTDSVKYPKTVSHNFGNGGFYTNSKVDDLANARVVLAAARGINEKVI